MKTHLDDFPNELLTEIFERVLPPDLETIKKVCRRWRQVADETVGVERHLGHRSGFQANSSSHEWHPLEVMLTEGISKCCVSIQSAPLNYYSTDDDDHCLGENQQTFPIFCSPWLVTHLNFYGDISRPYYARLMTPLQNLTELDIHISTLSTLSREKLATGNDLIAKKDLHLSISPRKLRTLRISMKGFEFWHLQMLRPSKMLRCIENLYDLLNGHYPHLQQFELGFPFFWDKESDMTKVLSRFLHAHHKFLKYLSLEFYFYWRLEDKSFEEMSVEDMNAYADIFELPELSDIVHLKRFNIDITDKRFIVPSIFYWEKLMLQQESLEHLKYKSGYHCSLPKCLIERNSTTLKSICMTVRANSVLPVDCKIIGKCSNLDRLELDGGLRLVHQVIGDTRGPHIVNSLCLPQSLRTIRLCSIFIEENDSDHICLGLRKLKTLHLEDIGQAEGLGLRFSTVCKICEKKQLDSFKIAAGLNEASLECAKKDWQKHSTYESLLMILATFYELPKMVKREADGSYIAEVGGIPVMPVVA